MGGSERLDSWKAIAAYLKRDESTVRRWEKEGLPVHRHLHAKKASVYAYPSEIDQWWNAGRTRLDAMEAATKGSRRTLARFFAAGLLVFGGAAGWFAAVSGQRWLDPPAGENGIRAIAILPFTNASDDVQQDYLADGMTDALINELGKVRALRVVSRTSAMAYKGTNKPVDQVARELSVDAIVKGSVAQHSGRARISVQLIRARPERQLWTERYERDFSGIMTLQRDVARAIATEIDAKLTPEERNLLARPRPVQGDAYQAYLKGRYHWNQASAQGLMKARESFEKAISKDPTFAPAYVGLADTYSWSYRWALPSLPLPREGFSKARSAALKALELDETLAEAHSALAYITEAHDQDWATAEERYRRAIQLNPNHANVRHLYALYLAIPRRFDEAFVQIRLAEELDPHSRPIKLAIGVLHFWSGQFDRAIQHWQMTQELEVDFPHTHYMLGLAYTAKGMYTKAIAAHRKGIALTGESARSLALLALAYGKGGQRAEALKIVDKLNERARREYISGYDMALAHMGLANKDEALRWLQTAFDAGDQELPGLNRAPFWWDSLRADPRFQDLVGRMRLPPIKQ